ncbi:hypothetical protein CHY08_22690 (plasmid) [Rhizobium leguminosarum bv. viciae]|uniref:hypothetical protein n=1 Tax=Rhizobium leguminosarum TaxID=384 RepID=UPI000B8CD090|nr:hypothetical protein [Rhizobium leguminosarum]ASR09920.1 hypothetical protein CHY08_22690 [Rhizobium leguminosarum bv. viciae]
MPYLRGLYPSATFNINLAPAFRAGALIQGEIFAGSATVTADLTASAARRGLRCFEFLTRLACSIDHGDAVEVLSDYVESELEEYPREVARLCEAGSRTLSHAAEMCRDVAAGQASEAEAKTVV